ncbi:hypothetical protein tb265_08870 [Gemmatimonadetes bacterium T265]|nr:hypothetical protein tb265_08870 [Gemmatimonadetes bacterium T265]
MRTTLDLNDALLVRAKAEAARKQTTLTRLIEEGLKLRLEQDEAPPEQREPYRVRVFGDPNGPKISHEEFMARVAAIEEEDDRRQLGLLAPRDEDQAA